MKVILVRHGEAVPSLINDADRQLTERGQKEALNAGVWLSHAGGWENLLVLVSPYVRAQETAGLILSSLSLATPIEEEVYEDLTPDSSPKEILERLESESRDVLIVSHMPLVGRLSSYLVEGRDGNSGFATAECRVLEGDCAASNCMTIQKIWYPDSGLPK